MNAIHLPKNYTFDHFSASHHPEQRAQFQGFATTNLEQALVQMLSQVHRLCRSLPPITPEKAEQLPYGTGVMIFLIGRELERRILAEEVEQMLHTLKEAGYPQRGQGTFLMSEDYDEETWPADQPPPLGPYFPPLAEIIRELGDKFGMLERFHSGRFGAYYPDDIGISGTGATPFLALARLWLEVQGMPDEEHNRKQQGRDVAAARIDNPRELTADEAASVEGPPDCSQPICLNPLMCAFQGSCQAGALEVADA